MDVLGSVLMLAGALIVLLAAVGLHRFDDTFARMHAAGKSTTMGLGLVLVGSAIRTGDASTWGTFAVVFILAVVTIPAGVHVIARSSFRSGGVLAKQTILDEASRRRAEHYGE
jgi:multicomponent Na+:H+ antiporter subunit G